MGRELNFVNKGERRKFNNDYIKLILLNDRLYYLTVCFSNNVAKSLLFYAYLYNILLYSTIYYYYSII